MSGADLGARRATRWRWGRAAGAGAGIAVAILGVLAVSWPDSRRRVEAWVSYHALGQVPPPLIAGLHGRLFLGNHAGDPFGSLITGVCNTSPAAVARAASLLRALLAAAEGLRVPFRLLLVPTAPVLYPEDLPPPYECPAPGLPRLTATLGDKAVIDPLETMRAMKPQFDAIPRTHFHWAGEAPLRVAEQVASSLGLAQTLQLPLHDDNRRSDLDGYDRGIGAHDRIREPTLAGIAVCEGGRRCPAAPDPAITTYTRPGAGRILVIADSFGDAIGASFIEFGGQVWLLRMNLALHTPPAALAAVAIAGFRPDAIVIVYHDAGALALDEASRLSLAAATAILRAGQP